MKLGSYVEVVNNVESIDQALAFYENLGFKTVGENIVTDGSINIRLQEGSGPPLSLGYMGSDSQAAELRDMGVQFADGTATLTTPGGLDVTLREGESSVPMPEGSPMERTPISRCGKFGEFAVSVADIGAARSYWEKLGFDTVYAPEEPDPYAILTDGLFVLGLHQTTDFTEPSITYFSGDMADRIETLQGEDLSITPVPPEVDGKVVNAELNAPGGHKIFLFYGEI